jgi:tyrosine-specific transport protein
VYHDLIPVLCVYLGNDRDRIQTSLVLGGLVPLLMFLAWDAVALALVPTGMERVDPLAVMMGSGGGMTAGAIQAFSMMAIVTSFIGTSLGVSWRPQKLFCFVFF